MIDDIDEDDYYFACPAHRRPDQVDDDESGESDDDATRYDDSEPRDPHGEWTSGGGTATAEKDVPHVAFDEPTYADKIEKALGEPLQAYADRVGGVLAAHGLKPTIEFEWVGGRAQANVTVIGRAPAGGEQQVKMERIYHPAEHTVDHLWMSVDPSLQGTGVSRDLLGATVDHYAAAGYDEARINATSVGGYAWAKLGFVPDKFILNQKTFKALGVKTPKDIWRVADSPAGKQALVGTSWSGELDLHDPEAMARFEKYVHPASARARVRATGKILDEGEAIYYDCGFDNATRSNPNHVPAGSPEGGQFTSASEGAGASPLPSHLQKLAEYAKLTDTGDPNPLKIEPLTFPDMARLAAEVYAPEPEDRAISITASLADEIKESPTHNTGFTYDKDLWPINTERFVVSVAGHEQSMDPRMLTARRLMQFRADTAKTTDGKDYIGGWYDPGDRQFYLDRSRGFSDFQSALDFAHANGQLSFFDGRARGDDRYITVGRRDADGYHALPPSRVPERSILFMIDRIRGDDDETHTADNAAADEAAQTREKTKWDGMMGDASINRKGADVFIKYGPKRPNDSEKI